MTAGRWWRVWGRAQVLGLVVVALAATGCRVNLATEIDVRGDGGGVLSAGVGFDGEALAAVGDLAVELAVDDLRLAGWSVSEARRERDGLTWVRASKLFADAPAASRALGELGPVFGDLRLVQERTLLRTRTTLRGFVDLTPGLPVLADPALVEVLGPEPLSLPSADALAQQLQAELTAHLTGNVRSNAKASARGRPVWSARPGERVVVSASGVIDRTALLLAGVSSTVIVSGAILAVVVVRRRRR